MLPWLVRFAQMLRRDELMVRVFIFVKHTLPTYSQLMLVMSDRMDGPRCQVRVIHERFQNAQDDGMPCTRKSSKRKISLTLQGILHNWVLDST